MAEHASIRACLHAMQVRKDEWRDGKKALGGDLREMMTIRLENIPAVSTSIATIEALDD